MTQQCKESEQNDELLALLVAQPAAALQPGCEEIERENKEMKRKWRENEEMERKWRGNGERMRK